jgi:hypothetical protein
VGIYEAWRHELPPGVHPLIDTARVTFTYVDNPITFKNQHTPVENDASLTVKIDHGPVLN